MNPPSPSPKPVGPRWTLGDRLRKARRVSNLQAAEMADQLGVHRNTISNYENDQGTPPDRRTLIAWSTVTGIPIEWIEHGETDPPERQSVVPLRGERRRNPGRKSNFRCNTDTPSWGRELSPAC